MPTSPAFGRQKHKEEACQFKASLDYTWRPCCKILKTGGGGYNVKSLEKYPVSLPSPGLELLKKAHLQITDRVNK